MSKKLYVTSMPFVITSEEFEKIFTPMGTVVSAKLIMNPATGKSKGFGFIEMSSEEEGEKAINELNGSSFGDRTISVSAARS